MDLKLATYLHKVADIFKDEEEDEIAPVTLALYLALMLFDEPEETRDRQLKTFTDNVKGFIESGLAEEIMA